MIEASAVATAASTAIPIKRKIYDWLAIAMPKPAQVEAFQKYPHLQNILVTERNQAIASDGYRMHIYPLEGEGYTPGYYRYDAKQKALIMQDAAAIGKEIYKSINEIYGKILKTGVGVDPLQLYGLDTDRGGYLPTVKWGIRAYGHVMMIRRAEISGTMRALIVGLNVAPCTISATGKMKELDRESYLTLEAKFLFDALEGDLATPIISWRGYREAVIVGGIGSCHAVIMPMAARN